MLCKPICIYSFAGILPPQSHTLQHPHPPIHIPINTLIPTQGELECPYHGWRFDATGTCTAIPQGGDCKDPRTAATALPCVVRQGMLWVKPVPLHMLTEDDEELTNPVLPLQPEIDVRG